jgi:glutamate racemase
MGRTRRGGSWTSSSAMNEGPIAFVDSGVGGLTYVEHARRRLPLERFIFAADRRNFPYGPKTDVEVTRAVVALMEAIVPRERPKLVVVACNTASVVSLAELRARFSVPFVGVVPAVKPAAEISRKKRIGVLATQRTVKTGYLRELIRRFAGGCVVTCLPSGDLVEFVV